MYDSMEYNNSYYGLWRDWVESQRFLLSSLLAVVYVGAPHQLLYVPVSDVFLCKREHTEEMQGRAICGQVCIVEVCRVGLTAQTNEQLTFKEIVTSVYGISHWRQEVFDIVIQRQISLCKYIAATPLRSVLLVHGHHQL